MNSPNKWPVLYSRVYKTIFKLFICTLEQDMIKSNTIIKRRSIKCENVLALSFISLMVRRFGSMLNQNVEETLIPVFFMCSFTKYIAMLYTLVNEKRFVIHNCFSVQVSLNKILCFQNLLLFKMKCTICLKCVPLKEFLNVLN